MRNARRLKGTHVSVNEHLTTRNAAFAKMARQLQSRSPGCTMPRYLSNPKDHPKQQQSTSSQTYVTLQGYGCCKVVTLQTMTLPVTFEGYSHYKHFKSVSNIYFTPYCFTCQLVLLMSLHEPTILMICIFGYTCTKHACKRYLNSYCDDLQDVTHYVSG